MAIFNVITWTADPEIFSFGAFTLRWYALMFIFGFMLASKMMEIFYKHDGNDPEKVYRLFLYTFLGTIIGARLGHCFFYDPEFYLAHPLEIFKTWKGGLASHGGTIGVVTAVWLYSRKEKLGFLWVLDRLAIAVAPVAAMIRIGNLFNHEIYGHPTDLPWAFRFIENIPAWQRGAEPIFTEPSHPTQLYEALCYLAVMVILLYLYYKTTAPQRRGLMIGVFFLGIFGSRILVEMVKNNQEEFEEGMLLNMGQILSIPIVIAAIWLIVRAFMRPPSTNTSGALDKE